LRRLAEELRPRAIAFVGKEAYRGTFGTRADHGLQERPLGDTALFVLPSTSPANAAVPYAERLRWFRALKDWLAGSSRTPIVVRKTSTGVVAASKPWPPPIATGKCCSAGIAGSTA